MKFAYIKVLDFPKRQKRERILPWILQQTAILGTMGFFRHVDVTLNYPEKIFIEAKKF